MENEQTKYLTGGGDDFITFLFSSNPREKNTVKLELDPPEKGIKIGQHIFQELLMTFTMCLRHFKNENDLFNINMITKENLETIKLHFQSFGFTVNVEKFTVHTYLDNMKLPNYFKEKHLIKDDTLLKDIYYESVVGGYIYRITFDFLK